MFVGVSFNHMLHPLSLRIHLPVLFLSFRKKMSVFIALSLHLSHVDSGKPNGGLPFPSPTIGHFIIKDVVPTPEGEAAKVKVKVRLVVHDLHLFVSNPNRPFVYG